MAMQASKVYLTVVSGLNATDKTPMYEMPLTLVFAVGFVWVRACIFCIGVLSTGILSLAFCPEISHCASNNLYNPISPHHHHGMKFFNITYIVLYFLSKI